MATRRTAKSTDAVSARHEAAHAVVSVRLNLPLVYTHIRRQTITEGDETFVSLGFTSIEEGSARGWIDALPDPVARERCEALALQTAGGPAADLRAGLRLGDVSHEGDMRGLVAMAGALGIGDEARPKWLSDQCNAAAVLLEACDDGAAWDRVRAVLERKRYLTGDEVRDLVAESDTRHGAAPWYCTADAAGRGLAAFKAGAA